MGRHRNATATRMATQDTQNSVVDVKKKSFKLSDCSAPPPTHLEADARALRVQLELLRLHELQLGRVEPEEPKVVPAQGNSIKVQ